VVTNAAIIGHAHAVPQPLPQQALWDDFFADHYGHHPVAAKIWQRSGVHMRHGVADPRTDDVSRWSTEQRMRRFVDEALPLGRDALSACLADAGVDGAEVGQFTVVTCTGYATPGLDILLARDLGMPDDTQRLHVGHMGCYAALPGLAGVADAAAARGKLGVLLCLELTSLHVQPATAGEPDVQQVVAHALFSDAAAAVAVAPDAPGLELVDIVARTDVHRAPLMTWDVTDVGFRMGLSPQVPDVLAEHVGGAVKELLGAHDLDILDVARWAIHPGGPRIVDVVADRLGLEEDAVSVSRDVLAEYGNCSSATVLLILDRITRQQLPPGESVVALAFGPGLTLYAALLRSRG
jgi:predicted naringenin-chalcone synthase